MSPTGRTGVQTLQNIEPGKHASSAVNGLPLVVDHAGSSSDTRFAAILQMASDAIISVDAEQRIILFNRGAEDIFGWASDEILGQPLDVLLPAAHRSIHRRHVEAFCMDPIPARPMATRQEVCGLRRSGQEFPAEASIVRTQANGQDILTVLLRDISHRRRREDRQRFLVEVSELLFRSLEVGNTLEAFGSKAVETLADHCVLHMVSEAGRSRSIQWFHSPTADAGLERLALDRQGSGKVPDLIGEILGDGRPTLMQDVELGWLLDLVLPPSSAPDDGYGSAEVEAGQTPAMGGLSVLLLPIRTPANPLGLAILIRSDRSEAFTPEILEMAEELGLRAGMALENARLFSDAQRAIQARDEVLGIVSHDLGNPLQAVFIGLDALERTRADGAAAAPNRVDDAGEICYLSAIRRSAEQMERLIRELLEVRRLEEGHLVLRKTPRSLCALVAESLTLLEPLARVRSVSLVNEVSASQGLEAPMDGDRLLQVLSNLIGNAVKHTARGGRVVVSALRRATEIQVSVADEGPGIPQEDLARVFERFWRAERARGMGGPGMGLGLAIARGIVQAHGGRIWAESEVGRGSVFHFSIPCPAT